MKKIKCAAALLACVMLISAFFTGVSAETLDFVPETRNGKIYGIPAGSTETQVALAYFNAVVDVLDADGKAVGKNTLIGTGFTVKLNSIAYTAVVMGDLDGDGKITTYDYVAIKRAYLGNLKLSTVALEAAGVRAGDRISALNYIMVKRAYFGTYNINNEYTCAPYDPAVGESGWTSGWV